MLACARADTLTKAIIYACAKSAKSPRHEREGKREGERKRGKDVCYSVFR